MYEFVAFDIDDKKMFRYMTEYYIGVFDSPGIFIIKDPIRKVYHRNYETYKGNKNLNNLTEEFLTKVNTNVSLPLYAHWEDCYMNV